MRRVRVTESPEALAPAEIGRLLAHADDAGLPRTLSRLDLVVIGVGAMVGGGVFVLTGIVAARFAGPAVVAAYLLAGGACALTAACYAELAGMLPVSGGAYAYARAAFGEFAGWIVGWLLFLEYALGSALVASGWSEYALGLARGLGVPSGLAVVRGLAPLAVVLVGALLALGVRPSAYAAAVLVLVKLAAAVLFVAFGAAFVQPSHWVPFVPPNAGSFGAFGVSGVVRATGLLFFAYAGFDAIPTAAQEARAPSRDVPSAILISVAVTVLVYLAVAGVLTGLVPARELGTVGLSQALAATGLGWLQVLVDAGVLAGLASVLVVMMLAQTRVAFAMARDGFLPRRAARVHPRLRTPLVATAATTALVAAATLLFPDGVYRVEIRPHTHEYRRAQPPFTRPVGETHRAHQFGPYPGNRLGHVDFAAKRRFVRQQRLKGVPDRLHQLAVEALVYGAVGVQLHETAWAACSKQTWANLTRVVSIQLPSAKSTICQNQPPNGPPLSQT